MIIILSLAGPVYVIAMNHINQFSQTEHHTISPFLLLLLLMVTANIQVVAQTLPTDNNPGYTITKRLLSIEDGLASHEVFCGVQDNAGFMWFGTRNGLNRYDGKNCLLFTRQRNNLQDNKVVQLAKDNDNNLFIEYGSTGFQLTTNGKVDVINATTQEVKTLTSAFPNLPFKEQDVYWISNDGSDDINFLVSHPFSLWKYNSKKGFTFRYEMKEWILNNSFSFINYRSTGPLCMFGKGKALLKISNQEMQYLVTADTVLKFVQQDALRSLPIGFSTEGALLITYNSKTSANVFSIAMLTPDGKIESPSDLKKYNLESVAGRYWFQGCSDANRSMSMLYISTDALYLWTQNAFLKVVSKSELKAFENLFLYELFNDNLGNNWLCTSIGVMQLKVEKNRFRQYFTNRQQSVQPNSQARGIYADGKGKVMANVWTHLFRQENDHTQWVTDEEIKYAITQHHSMLYCGAYNLFRYNEENNKLVNVPGGQGSEIWSMHSINDSLLLLGRTNGFSLFNSNTGRFDSLLPSNKNAPDAKFVYRFFTGHDDTIRAVAENGLYKIFPGNNRWLVAGEQSATIERLSLLDGYAGENGMYWLATNGEGLYRWDRKTNLFKQFNITQGFPSDVLYRIEPDEYDNLWISSDYGLIRFNQKTAEVTTYTTTDGISHNEFNRTSSYRAGDGRLFFGGLDGVNAFYPKDFVTDTSTLNSPLQVIAFNQFVGAKNKLVNKTTELLKTLQITLAPDDKFFTLEFQLLDFAKDEAYHYAYKLEGSDKDWIYINENAIHLSGAPYGKFTLLVKAQKRGGAWNKNILSIKLVVLKPFYLRWWFILLAALLFATTIYLVIHFRIKQLAADKKKLERTVNERTAQLKQSLSEQSALLLEKDVLMKEIHHRVKNNLQVISGLLELQSKGLQDETARDALREGRNRVRSIALIHQNLYQFENLSTVDLKRFVNDLCRQVESVFQKQQLITLKIKVPDLHLDIDSAVPLGLIMNELLSNSFKYAFNDGAGGVINLEIVAVSEGKYQLLYFDNGPGLPVDFEVTNAATLGIQLIYDLSRQIGGSVTYENKNGALFKINFTNRNTRKSED